MFSVICTENEQLNELYAYLIGKTYITLTDSLYIPIGVDESEWGFFYPSLIGSIIIHSSTNYYWPLMILNI